MRQFSAPTDTPVPPGSADALNSVGADHWRDAQLWKYNTFCLTIFRLIILFDFPFVVIPFLNVLTYQYSVVDPSNVDPDPGFWSKMLKIALVEKNS